MFKKSTKITGPDSTDLSNYIEEFDVYNSELLSKINNLDPDDRETYIISKYPYRPDLICREYYGSSSYYGIFLITCGKSLSEMALGTKLRLIPKSTVDRLIGL